MSLLNFSSLSLSSLGSGSFMPGESAGIPTYNFGGGLNSGVANTSGSAAYSLCSAMGGSADTCGVFGAQAGSFLGMATSQQGINAYGAATPANTFDSAFYGGGAGDAYTKGSAAYYKNGWLCRLGMSGCDQKAYAQATANGMSTLSWLTDPTRIVVIIIGIVLLGAGLFMLKSPITIASSLAKGALSGS